MLILFCQTLSFIEMISSQTRGRWHAQIHPNISSNYIHFTCFISLAIQVYLIHFCSKLVIILLMLYLISCGSSPYMVLINDFRIIMSSKLIIILTVTLASHNVRSIRILIYVQLIDINTDIRVNSGRKILLDLLRTAPTVIGNHPVYYRNSWTDIWVHIVEMLRKSWPSWVENVLIDLFTLDYLLLIYATQHPDINIFRA